MGGFPRVGQLTLNYIDGAWEESSSGKWTERYDPADQSVLVTRAPDSNRDDGIRAIDAAARAAAGWRDWPAPKRGRLLFDWLSWIDDSRSPGTASGIKPGANSLPSC